MVSGFVELTLLIIMRFVRCCPRSGEEWALLLLDGGSFMFGILVKISWSWSLSFNPKGASGTSGISAGEESVGHRVVRLVVHIYNWGM